MTITTYSDMGCLKIFNNGLSVFFNNHIGDTENIVEILDKSIMPYDYLENNFIEVKKKVFISLYDTTDDNIYELLPGRYWITLIKEAHFIISKFD